MPQSLVVLFEHAPRVERLVECLRSLGVAVETVDIQTVASADLEPGAVGVPVVNRVGAYPAGANDPWVVLQARQYLEWLESRRRRVFNGAYSYRVATSKLEQVNLIGSLRLRAPSSRPVYGDGGLNTAAAYLRYPLIFKPNVGGSGTGVRILQNASDLAALVADPQFDHGTDGVGVLQEYHCPRDGSIVRLELVNGELLYGTRQAVVAGSFNYCAVGGYHAATGSIEVIDPPAAAVDEARRILRAARADFGAVEYVVSERDGERYWFDINPFSNYLSDVEAIGFDPCERLAGFLAEAAS